MTAAKSKEQATSLQHIDVEKIDVEQGFNPRGIFDQEKLDELAASVKAFGLLMPILVQPGKDGRFTLVAGERRVRAARLAKLATVPAQVRDANGSALSLAVVENLHRADLNPVEEGFAYKRAISEAKMQPKALAKALNVSLERIEDRIALTSLPEKVQDGIAAGTCTLTAARNLVAIHEQVPGLTEPLARTTSSDVLSRNPGGAIHDLLRSDTRPMMPCPECNGFGVLREIEGDDGRESEPFESEEAAQAADEAGEALEWCQACGEEGRVPDPDADELVLPFLAFVGQTIDKQLVEQLDDKAVNEAWAAHQKAVAAWQQRASYGYVPPAQITNDVEDAARSYGCLLAFGDTNRAFITDREFLAAAIVPLIEQATKRYEAGDRTKPKAEKKGDADLSPAQKKEKEERAKQRERAKKAVVTGEQFNLDLGAAIATKLAEPKVNVAWMKLIVGEILDRTLAPKHSYMSDQLQPGLAGFVKFTEPAPEHTKAGKPTYPRKWDEAIKPYAERVWREFNAAKTPEQVLGVLARAMAAAAFTDLRGLPNADCDSAGSGFGREEEAQAILAKLLPKPLMARCPNVKRKGPWSHTFSRQQA